MTVVEETDEPGSVISVCLELRSPATDRLLTEITIQMKGRSNYWIFSPENESWYDAYRSEGGQTVKLEARNAGLIGEKQDVWSRMVYILHDIVM